MTRAMRSHPFSWIHYTPAVPCFLPNSDTAFTFKSGHFVLVSFALMQAQRLEGKIANVRAPIL